MSTLDYAYRLGCMKGAVRLAVNLLDERKGPLPAEALRILARALSDEDAREVAADAGRVEA